VVIACEPSCAAFRYHRFPFPSLALFLASSYDRRRSSRHRRLVCISVCLFLCSCCALVITCGYWLRAALCGVPLPQMLPPLSPDTNLPRVPVVDVLLSPMLELEFNNSEARRSMTSGYHAPACLPSATHQPRMCVSDQPHTSAVSDQPRTCVQ
jgi:hypothetical protein